MSVDGYLLDFILSLFFTFNPHDESVSCCEKWQREGARGRISLQSAGAGSGHKDQGTGKGGGRRAVECYGCLLWLISMQVSTEAAEMLKRQRCAGWRDKQAWYLITCTPQLQCSEWAKLRRDSCPCLMSQRM